MDFHVLNQYIKCKPYPLPKISDLLQKLEGFTWATALDLNMEYYHIVLDTESSYLCTMIVPWGKYQYCCLPMGLNGSPDTFQAIINDIMGNLPNVHAYLDGIIITMDLNIPFLFTQKKVGTSILPGFMTSGHQQPQPFLHSPSLPRRQILEWSGFIILKKECQPSSLLPRRDSG